jgi:hypothetical protein
VISVGIVVFTARHTTQWCGLSSAAVEHVTSCFQNKNGVDTHGSANPTRVETKKSYKQKVVEWNLWAVRQIFLAAKPVLIDLCVTLASPVVLTIPSKPSLRFHQTFPVARARCFGGKWEVLGYGCKLAGAQSGCGEGGWGEKHERFSRFDG